MSNLFENVNVQEATNILKNHLTKFNFAKMKLFAQVTQRQSPENTKEYINQAIELKKTIDTFIKNTEIFAQTHENDPSILDFFEPVSTVIELSEKINTFIKERSEKTDISPSKLEKANKIKIRLDSMQERLKYLDKMQATNSEQSKQLLDNLIETREDLKRLKTDIEVHPSSDTREHFDRIVKKVNQQIDKRILKEKNFRETKEITKKEKEAFEEEPEDLGEESEEFLEDEFESEEEEDDDDDDDYELSDKEYQGWLADTIEATWEDLEQLTDVEEKTAEGLEYLRRVIHEVKQELHKTIKKNMEEEQTKLKKLIEFAQKRLTQVKENLTKKLKKRKYWGDKKLLEERIRKPVKRQPTRKETPKEKGIFAGFKTLLFAERTPTKISAPAAPKPQYKNSGEVMMAMLKKAEKPKPGKFKTFVNVLRSSAYGTSAYDKDLFGDNTVYRTEVPDEDED